MAEENTAADHSQEATPSGSKGPLIPPIMVRIAIMGGILAALAVGALFLVTDVIAPRIQALGKTTAEEPAAAEDEHGAAPAAEKGGHAEGEKGGKGKKHEVPGVLVPIEDLVVNPAGTGGRRFLKVAAAIELHDPKLAKEMEERQAPLRDLLIRELSSRTLEELTDPTAKEEMRQGILEELETMMGPGKVTGLYFTEYVVQ